MKLTPLILAFLLTLPAAPLSAASLTWSGGDALNNNWSDADNWNPAQSPRDWTTRSNPPPTCNSGRRSPTPAPGVAAR